MSSTEKLGKMPGKQEEPPLRRAPNSRHLSLAALMTVVRTSVSKKDATKELMPAAKDTKERLLYING